ncbi:MAG: ABC transporter ATP-binding protein [Candidatus Spyradocola sp.]
MKHNLQRTLRLLREMDRAYLPLSLLKALLATLTPLGALWLTSLVLDGLTARQPFSALFSRVMLLLAALFLTGLAAALLTRRLSISRERMGRAFRFKAPEKTLTMDYALLDDPQTRRLRTDMATSSHWGYGFLGVVDLLTNLLSQSCELLLSAALLLYMLVRSGRAWPGTAAYLLLIGAFLALVSRLHSRWRKAAERTMNAASPKMSILFHLLYETGASYRTGKDVRIYRAAPLFRSFVQDNYSAISQTLGRDLLHVEGKVGALQEGVNATVLGAGYVLATVLAILGRITAGQVVLFAGAVSRFGTAARALSASLASADFTLGRIQPALDYLDLPNSQHKGTLPVEKRDDNEYELELRDVSFRYPGQQNWALRHVSLRLRIGERLAVVGLNGSGKTTLVKLLARLYDPTEGIITLNGIDIRKYDLAEYRSLFSVVFQDFKLLSFPIGQNVTASAAFDAQKARDSLIKSGFGDRLETLPQGLSTPLYQDFSEDGVEISGGEAQKIALARALYKNAPFIVLDEPTAALDPIAEADVYARFDAIVGNRTALYISHRLSSCRFCDDIAVFEDGRIVQRGSHAGLLASGGLYARLWHAQAQYYRPEA